MLQHILTSSKKLWTKKKTSLVLIALLFFGLVGTVFFYQKQNSSTNLNPKQTVDLTQQANTNSLAGGYDPTLSPETMSINQQKTQSIEKIEKIKKNNKFSLLLIGYGGPGHQGGMLTDVMQLAFFDTKEKKVYMISVPRDMQVNCSNQTNKINHCLARGMTNGDFSKGANNLKKTFSEVSNLAVDYYFAVDFVGFKRLIGEVLDGIEVDVSEELDDPWYPIQGMELATCGHSPEEVAELTRQYSGFALQKQFPCRYEHIHYEVGPIHMEGGDALKYVRSRHGSAAGDFSRSKRQQDILIAVKNKLISLEGITKAPEFFKQASHTFHSDLDIYSVKELAKILKDIDNYDQISIILDTSNVFKNDIDPSGQYVLIPKAGFGRYQKIHQHIEDKMK